MKSNVLVIIGAGGIGLAIARREGAGKIVLLADINEKPLKEAADSLESAGYVVKTQQVDISSQDSVKSLATTASQLECDAGGKFSRPFAQYGHT